MKLFKKTMAIVASIAIISSFSVFNIAKAADVRSYSLALTDADGVAVESIAKGDSFYIEVKLSDDNDMRGFAYFINVSEDDVTVSNETINYGGRPAVILEAHVDKEWYSNPDLNTTYFSNRKYMYNTETKQISGVVGGDAVSADYALQDAIVGRHLVTAARDITAAAPLVISVNDGEGTNGSMETVQISGDSITFPEAPAGPTELKATAKMVDPVPSPSNPKTTTQGITGKVDVPAGKTFSKLVFALNNGSGDDQYWTWDLGTAIQTSVESYGVNILGVPSGIIITCSGVEVE